MNIPIDEVQNDTNYVLSHKLPGENISNGHWAIDSPIFDALAADRFAIKVENPAERRNHEFDRLDNYEEFNLGDYR